MHQQLSIVLQTPYRWHLALMTMGNAFQVCLVIDKQITIPTPVSISW